MVDHLSGVVAVVEEPSGVVEHFTHPDVAAGEFRAGLLDAEDDEVQALERAGRGEGNPLAEDNRALGAGRRELHHPVVLVGDVVDVHPKSRRLVETLGPPMRGRR
ncbi:hypothetical protein [Streptomyces sp. NPDC002346]